MTLECRKKVHVTFVGDDEVFQHIVSLKERKQSVYLTCTVGDKMVYSYTDVSDEPNQMFFAFRCLFVEALVSQLGR